TKPAPYTEDDLVAPISIYGASKADGEAAIRRDLDRHVIVRTSWVYGVHGANFVKTMLRLAAAGKELRVVNDQRGCPTAAADLAAAIVAIAGRWQDGLAAWGTYHYCGRGATTWYGFAREILRWREERGGSPIDVTPITSADYPTAARRPANSELECARVVTIFGVERPAWRVSLRQVLDALGAPAARAIP
ncbi:MAG: SDR family oxidoreductase, partial [Dongiaceae bacterium]